MAIITVKTQVMADPMSRIIVKTQVMTDFLASHRENAVDGKPHVSIAFVFTVILARGSAITCVFNGYGQGVCHHLRFHNDLERDSGVPRDIFCRVGNFSLSGPPVEILTAN